MRNNVHANKDVRVRGVMRQGPSTGECERARQGEAGDVAGGRMRQRVRALRACDGDRASESENGHAREDCAVRRAGRRRYRTCPSIAKSVLSSTTGSHLRNIYQRPRTTETRLEDVLRDDDAYLHDANTLPPRAWAWVRMSTTNGMPATQPLTLAVGSPGVHRARAAAEQSLEKRLFQAVRA